VATITEMVTRREYQDFLNDCQRAPHGCVYLVLDPVSNRVKIGTSGNPYARLLDIQAACPNDLEVLLVIPHGGRWLERELHERFRDFRVRGEWFYYSGEIRDFVQQKRWQGVGQPDSASLAASGYAHSVAA